ncbi:hypothetical protein C530_215 [Candidatus Portiera aleyrodidarum BT-B-HRs]|nr:hypothetical protein C548_214 [Candidatus Portiera aleyrodidarum BT-QVLC]AFT80858.1 hypothetical protein C530_215 [Candidatus Portiera aleyrodidarum BT-B-HRs]
MFDLDCVYLHLNNKALKAIVNKAILIENGARGLRYII